MDEFRMSQKDVPANHPNVIAPTCEGDAFQKKAHSIRTLSAEEAEKLARDQTLVSDFKQSKLEKEAQKNWDLFYKRNSTNFFKDRHWTTREFEELKACREFENQKLTILEAGCGVGNCLFPLLKEDFNIFAYACDFSPRAVEYVKVLKPGKCILFRDYGLYDHAMLRFKSGSKLGDNFYVRQDGTRSYFFTHEFLSQLFMAEGYEQVVNEYVLRETVNRKEGLCVPRIFLQSKFRKPLSKP
ncbi:tRNA N(3)-methylcytidine methyltransferase METTL6 isoform X3 [Alligator mississippiensis]|uniref:tRNA N(3)-methylcytidine methyltransferase METTL6 isoform X3 n=1 Tax=Alligator mississippiensis TaxID=8496 RepID=UPI000906FCC7|nr:tRNA N(3)-methylcytidine methyltransferase METTL6 isoform X3 [Alligator mississippiensis]